MSEKPVNTDKSPEKDISKKYILIIGDWVVDDYWLVSNHRSETSSRTGLMHHRALHRLNASIRAFCLAGQTASVLHKSRLSEKDPSPLFDILGVGLWHKDDDIPLLALFDEKYTNGLNPYRLSKKEEEPEIPKDIELLNLFKYIDGDDKNYDIGTTRAIRTYLKVGKKTNQLQRIDWEIQSDHEGHHEDVPIDRARLIKAIREKVQKHKNTPTDPKDPLPGPDAIVIKDSGRGVINSELIEALLDQFPDASWFISTKAWKPDWLINNLWRMKLELLLIPDKAAQAAIDANDINVWTTHSGCFSKKVLTEIKALRERNPNTNPLFVILPGDLNTLALDYRNPSKPIGLVYKDESKKLDIETNMASVFFGAIIAQILINTTQKNPLKELIERTLNFTYKWQKHDMKRITEHETWDVTKQAAVTFDKLNEKDAKSGISITGNIYDLRIAEREWENAFDLDKLGIVEIGKDKQEFQLWRAMTELDGYICCIKEKRKNLTKLVHAVSNYTKQFKSINDGYPQVKPPQESCLIVAKAGTGKTSLVRMLATNNKIRFLPYNITQMNGMSDLYDCFDSIVTTSLQDPSTPILVFIDEINSKLGNEAVYKSFLAPLEDSVYIKGGRSFRLPPCFWVFASAQGKDEIRGVEKGSDFISRLSNGTVSLSFDDFDRPPTDEERMENVYFGVAMVLSVFPDVREISKEVLQFFAEKLGKARMREIRHFVEKFHNVNMGRVTMKNVSSVDLDTIQIQKSDITSYLKRELEKSELITIKEDI
jgi:hypothetical protein